LSVGLDGPFGDAKLRTDLRVRHSFGQELDDLLLAR
jgi:hypothetical protein